jgi:hypothetical protein
MVRLLCFLSLVSGCGFAQQRLSYKEVLVALSSSGEQRQVLLDAVSRDRNAYKATLLEIAKREMKAPSLNGQITTLAQLFEISQFLESIPFLIRFAETSEPPALESYKFIRSVDPQIAKMPSVRALIKIGEPATIAIIKALEGENTLPVHIYGEHHRQALLLALLRMNNQPALEYLSFLRHSLETSLFLIKSAELSKKEGLPQRP